MSRLDSLMQVMIIFACIALVIFCMILVDIWINRIVNLKFRWNEELKDRFLDWYWLRKKKAALRRIDVNRYKFAMLSEVEEELTPEMMALSTHIMEDIKFVNSYILPEQTDMEKAVPVTEDEISMATLIFNKIDEMIILETQHVLFPLAATGNGIDVRDFGDHVKTVAEATKNGLNLGIYKTATVFTPEYINSYIVKKSTVMVLTTMNELNSKLPPNI